MYRGRHRCSQAGQRRQEAAQQHRHAAWVTTYEAIHTLRAQGTSVTTIAAQLGISRPTVYAYLRRTRPPSPRSPQRSGQVLRPYMAYLVQRWREGCTDSMQLWREMRALGYAYSSRTVSRFHDPAAASERCGLGSRDADLVLYTPARAVGPGGLVHLGMPRSEAGAGRAAVC